MTLRIGIDLDGVLADFRSAFRATAMHCLRRDVDDPAAALEGTPGSLTDKDIRKVWDHIAQTPNWWMEVPAFEPEQIARLYACTRASAWEVFFLTRRPASAGDSVQFQTQWWIERHGFYMPAVLTIPGSRGEVANALRLNLVIDDLLLNCIEVVSASAAKALLLLRSGDTAVEQHALSRGIGVVPALAEAIEVTGRLHALLPGRSGRLLRLADWFTPEQTAEPLPHNPRDSRPLPPSEG